MNPQLDNVIDYICDQDVRYKRDVYDFVMEALNYTQKRFRRVKHVTGEELLEGIRLFSMEKFGPMALTVLNHWGVQCTEDFGCIVFNLVENKILSKTDEDSVQSFKKGFDFQEAFGTGYQRQLEKKISRMRSM